MHTYVTQISIKIQNIKIASEKFLHVLTQLILALSTLPHWQPLF